MKKIVFMVTLFSVLLLSMNGCAQNFLQKLQGVPQSPLLPVMLPAHFELPRADKRREFLRVRRNAAGGLDLFTNQSSGVLTSAVWADGLVDNPAGHSIAHGDLVAYLSFADLLA